MKREAESELDDNPAQRRRTGEREPSSIDDNEQHVPTLSTYPSITADTETASTPMTFPEYDAATTARHDAATVEDPKLARRRKAMTGKPDHVFTTTFSDTDGQSQVVSINRSFDGAVLAAWYALKDYGYEEDFLVRAQDHLDATDVSESDEANHEHMKEALTNAMLLEGDLSGQRLEFDLDTDQYEPVAASFTIELHHVED